jgi:hypothetical protein
MSAIDAAKNLFGWWAGSASIPYDESWFARNFVFDTGIGGIDRDDLRRRVENGLPLSDVKVLHTVTGDDDMAMFFEATDEVTDLRHRFGWFVQFHGDSIQKIVETNMILPSREVLSVWKP